MLFTKNGSFNCRRSEVLSVADHLRVRFASEEFQRIVNGTASSVENVDRTTKAMAVIAEELQRKSPSMIGSTDQILANTAGITHEVNVLGQRVNKPLTTKQKIFSFFLESVGKSAPVLLRR
jgi:hypothetical protein